VSRPRFLILIGVLVVLAAGFVACGGDDDGGGAQEVVDRTFSGDHESVLSGRFEVRLDISAPSGDFNAEFGGPFQREGEGFPEFDLEARLTGTGEGGLDFRGSATSTGGRGFIGYEGHDYEIDPSLFGLFTSYYESLEGESEDGGAGLTEQLGFDPKSWLTDLQDEGQAEVDGTQTDHVSGKVDLDRVSADLRSLADRLESQLGALEGLGGGRVPDPPELDDFARLAESATFDLYSGTDDHIVRRFDVSLRLKRSGGTVDFGITLSEVNEEQTIAAPSNPRPLSELLERAGISDELEGLDGWGGLGGGSGGGGGAGGGSGGGGATPDQFRDYTRCLQGATSPADIDRCNALL
jgi:hypothetical protein